MDTHYLIVAVIVGAFFGLALWVNNVDLKWRKEVSRIATVWSESCKLITSSSRHQPPPHTTADLSIWRSSPDHTSYASSLLSEPKFRELLAVLSNIRPARHDASNATSCIYDLGQRVGMDLIIASILSAGTPPPQPPTEVPQDYGANEINWDNQ